MDATSRKRQADLLLRVCSDSSGLSNGESVELLRLLRKSGASHGHNHLVAELGTKVLQGSWLGDECKSFWYLQCSLFTVQLLLRIDPFKNHSTFPFWSRSAFFK